MNRKALGLLILIASLLASSCEQQSEYVMSIANNSSDTISIYFTGSSSYTNGTDTVIAPPYLETIYFSEFGWTVKEKNMDCDPQIMMNEVTVTLSSNRTLLKNIWDKQEWLCETDKDNTFWKMIFKIEETDIE